MNLINKLLNKKTYSHKILISDKLVKQPFNQGDQELNEEQLKYVSGAGSRVASDASSREST